MKEFNVRQYIAQADDDGDDGDDDGYQIKNLQFL